MALVVVRRGSAAPLLHRQPGLRPVQRLDRALLVEAEHRRVLRRVEVQAHHVAQPLLEARVRAQLKVRDRCGFRPRARHVRFTKFRDAPTSRAIDRHDHCVASFGSRVVVASTMRLRSASRSASLRPPCCRPAPAPSRSPPSPPPRTASASAPPCSLPAPAAPRSPCSSDPTTPSARSANAPAGEPAHCAKDAHRSSCARSAFDTSTLAATLMSCTPRPPCHHADRLAKP